MPSAGVSFSRVGIRAIALRHPVRVAALGILVVASVFPALGLVVVLSQAIKQLQSDPTQLLWSDLLGEQVAQWVAPYLQDTPLEVGLSVELQLQTLPLALAAVGLLHAALKAAIEFSIEDLGEEAAKHSRDQVMTSFFSRDFSQARSIDPALLSSMVGEDAREIKFGTRRVLGLIPMNLLQSVVLLAWLVVLDPELFALFVAVLLPAGIMIRVLGKKLKELAKQGLRSQTEVLGLFVERLSGWETIRVFQTVALEVEKFRQKNMELFKSLRRSARAKALGAPTVEWLGTVAAAFVLILALRRLSVGTISDSVLTGFLVTIGHLSGTLQGLTRHFNAIKRAQAAENRINGFLGDMPPREDQVVELDGEEREQRQAIETLGAQELSVSHSDQSGTLLENVNFELRKGDFCTITGESGSGKSTLLRCLLGLEEPKSGRVLINGRSPTPADWLKHSSDLVFLAQEPFVVPGDLFQNILYPTDVPATSANEDLQHSKAQAALQRAGLSKPLSTPSHELSGGEKQRLVLARAFFKEATLWVLDEATSALDAQTERSFLNVLKENSKDHIIVFVTHRKSVLDYSNRHIQTESHRAAGPT